MLEGGGPPTYLRPVRLSLTIGFLVSFYDDEMSPFLRRLSFFWEVRKRNRSEKGPDDDYDMVNNFANNLRLPAFT